MKTIILALFLIAKFAEGVGVIGINEQKILKHSFHYDPNPHPLPVFSYGEKDLYSPLNWGLINSNCDGQAQSPVHLQESSAVPISSPLVINGLDKVPSSIKVINNGHSAGMEFNFDDGEVTFSSGPLDLPYILKNVHWHWGQSDFGGSEHALNGFRYDAEAHFVSYNSKYESLSDAMTQPDGLAVLGIFYSFDNTSTIQNPFVKFIPGIIEADSHYETTENLFTVRDLIKSDDMHILSYKGSLTTPGCFETVTWMVSTNPLNISSNELAQFRKIKDHDGELIFQNFRPLQKFGFRILKLFY